MNNKINFKEIRKEPWGNDFIKGYMIVKKKIIISNIKKFMGCYLVGVIGALIITAVTNII